MNRDILELDSINEIFAFLYERSKVRNPRISLRRFAHVTGMSAGFLSDLIAGKAIITGRKAYDAALKAKVDEITAQYVCLVAAKHCATTEIERKAVENQLDYLRDFALGQRTLTTVEKLLRPPWGIAVLFRISSNANGYCVSQLLKEFGMSPSVLKSYLSTLETLGFLKINSDHVRAVGNLPGYNHHVVEAAFRYAHLYRSLNRET